MADAEIRLPVTANHPQPRWAWDRPDRLASARVKRPAVAAHPEAAAWTHETVARFLAGHPDASLNFMRRIRPALNVAVHRVRSRWRLPCVDEEDLLQEIMAELLEDDARPLRRWDPKKGRTLESFLRTFASFRAHDLLSARKHEIPVDAQELAGLLHRRGHAAPPPDEDLWIASALERYRAQCSATEWRFVSALTAGANTEEMMSEFGLKRNAVSQRVCRLRRHLRRLSAALD